MSKNIQKMLDKIEERKTPLEYDDFKDYYIGTTKEGQQWLFRFENGYGASVIKNYGSYGFEDDLFELAVIYFTGDDNNNFILSYNTSITDDVIGFLSNDNVLEYLEKIKGLDEHGR